MSANIDIQRPSFVYRPKTITTAGSESPAGARPKTVDAPPTVVVFGVPRGGTTMVAGVVQRCGVHLGDDLPVNLEDQLFVAGVPIPEMLRTIEARNESNRMWGWKFPRAASYIQTLEPHLRNPHYIVVWRDVFATATRSIRRGHDVVHTLNWAHEIQAQNIRAIEQLNGPSMLVSYEKAVLSPKDLAIDIKNFIGSGAEIDEEELLRFAEPGSYK